MTAPVDSKFSLFANGGDLIAGDTVVGLRGGVNTKFNNTGGVGTFLPLLGGTMLGAIDMGGFKITDLATPTDPADAVTKLYVDTITTGTALTKTDDTNVTLTLGGSPTTALLNAASLALGWTGTLAVSRGGSGAGTLTGLLTGSGTSAFVGTAITQYNILSGGASNLPNSIAPSATSGVPLISQGAASQPVFGTAVVSGGGTGNTTFTAYSLICAGTTATGVFQNVSGVGTLNQVLISQGAGALPQWGSVPGVSPAALTKTDDTNVTLTLGGTPSTALLQATSLTLGWTGQLGLTRGGTAASLTASNGGIVYSTASALAILGGTATANQILMSGSSTTPAWSTTTYPATNAINTIMYASSANVLGVITPVNSAVLISSAGGVPSMSTTLPSGLTIPGYQATITPAALTKTDDTNVTLTLGGTPATSLLQATSLTLGWTGNLAVGRGGTGNTTFTAYSVLCAGTTATGAFQNVSGVGTAGQVLSSNGAGALPSWATIPGATSAALTKTDDTNVTLTLGGAPTTALLTAASITAGWTGQLGLTRGGTAASLTASNGGIVYSGASALAILSGTATAGLALLSGASTTPSWSSSPPFTRIAVQVITSTSTYTPTAGSVYFIVEGVGGGGGGGGAATTGATQGAAGCGGGYGGYFRKEFNSTEMGANAAVTIGAAGAAGSAGNNAGGTGGNTVFDPAGTGATLTGNGGVGGAGQSLQATLNINDGAGSGGAASNGDLNVTGAFGLRGQTQAVAGNQSLGGDGANGIWGQGGRGSVNAAAASAGTGNGAGGAGGCTYNGSQTAGSAGSIGLVVVTEFISV